jgi:hypothetical protein
MLTIKKQGFPRILHDSDQMYLEFVLAALKHSDPEGHITMYKFDNEIKVTVVPSDPKYREHIIENLLNAHRLFKLKITFSKSLAISTSVSYSIIW